MFKIKPDLIHIHTASRGSFYRKSIFIITSKIFRKKTLVHLHGAEFNQFYYQESGTLKKYYIRKILKSCEKVIVLSEKWNSIIKSIDTNIKTTVLYNSVPIPNEIEIKKNNKNKTLLFMGRVDQRKGIHDLLDVLTLLKDDDFDFECLICGDGDIKLWQDKAYQMNLKDNIKFEGWVDLSKKKELYRSSDIYILPSYNEGMPMSVLEAVSYGLPVISTNVGGIPDIVVNGYNGYLVLLSCNISLLNI